MKTLKNFSKKQGVKKLNTKQTTLVTGGNDLPMIVIPWKTKEEDKKNQA